MKLPDSQQVIDIMRETAAELILPRFRQLADDEIKEKSPGDLVTVADVESEHRLEQALTALVPGSRCVGEEAAEANPEIINLIKQDQPVWIIDPLDGTRNFANGRSPFAVIVAYCVAGETYMGWIYNPLSGQTVWAVKGQGVWNEKGHKLALSRKKNITDMNGSLSKIAAGKIRDRKNAPTQITRVGCVGQDYMDLASSALNFARYAVALKPWDHAAGVLIHEQAGGYSHLIQSNRPYRPTLDPEQAKKSGEILMLAPDQESWHRLSQLIGDL